MIDIIDLARRGLAVTVVPIGWPMHGTFQGVRVSVSGFDWNNSVLTRNFELTAAELAAADDPARLIRDTISATVRESHAAGEAQQ